MRFLFVLFLPMLSLFAEITQAVTYNLGSRFGDNLLSVLHAQWIAYKYDLPLVHVPFDYSSFLNLDNEIKLRKVKKSFKKNVITLQRGEGIDPSETKPVLYRTPYFPEGKYELELTNYASSYFSVDWKDPGFRAIALQLITPKQPVNTIQPPKNTINIAIHVRDGEGFDDAQSKTGVFAAKFAPLSFYAKALEEVLRLFGNKPIYCYIFTDMHHPEKAAKYFKRRLPPNSIQFDWRKTKNRHNMNVLEDFYSFFNFDILIRPDSNFSRISSLLRDFAIVISTDSGPTSMDIERNEVYCHQLLAR